MADETLGLAFSIHSARGTYAVLLGSGVSRSAQIPTGWEVVEDLIRKIAAAEGEEAGADPAAWFRAWFNAEPAYSEILGQLANTPAERSALLRGYFEPSQDEKEIGAKLPTPAHKAIAQLVAAGFIRIILTTNFDRLMEQALSAEGVEPVVVAGPEAARGVAPLHQIKCLIVKIHGDYLHLNMRNTVDELQQYEGPMNALLGRILEDYGLVICGWSAEYDVALRRAIERTRSRRFTTFWTTRGQMTEEASQLIALRGAIPISISEADQFFRELLEKVVALERVGSRHPLSAATAVESLKRFLSDDRHRIELEDLVNDEGENFSESLSKLTLTKSEPVPSEQNYMERLNRYEVATDVALRLTITGCYWGNGDARHLWVRLLERALNQAEVGDGYQVWIYLQRYPALLLLYGGGIASIIRENYGNLLALLGAERRERYQTTTAIKALRWHAIVSHDFMKKANRPPQGGEWLWPVNQYLAGLFQPLFAQWLPDDLLYNSVFDRFEYLLSLLMQDAGRLLLGRYIIHAHNEEDAIANPAAWLDRELQRYPSGKHPLLAAGGFGGDQQKLLDSKGAVDSALRRGYAG